MPDNRLQSKYDINRRQNLNYAASSKYIFLQSTTNVSLFSVTIDASSWLMQEADTAGYALYGRSRIETRKNEGIMQDDLSAPFDNRSSSEYGLLIWLYFKEILQRQLAEFDGPSQSALGKAFATMDSLIDSSSVHLRQVLIQNTMIVDKAREIVQSSREGQRLQLTTADLVEIASTVQQISRSIM